MLSSAPMLEWMLFRAIMVAFFILANSFFVAAEFALISSSRRSSRYPWAVFLDKGA